MILHGSPVQAVPLTPLPCPDCRGDGETQMRRCHCSTPHCPHDVDFVPCTACSGRGFLTCTTLTCEGVPAVGRDADGEPVCWLCVAAAKEEAAMGCGASPQVGRLAVAAKVAGA